MRWFYFLAVCVVIKMLGETLEQIWRAQTFDSVMNPKREPVTVAVQNMNEMSTVGVSIDVERSFCLALINFPNTTEAYWLNGNPSKWQSMGGIGRSDFVECKKNLTQIGALELKNPNAKNSTHRVANKHILARRAGGRL